MGEGQGRKKAFAVPGRAEAGPGRGREAGPEESGGHDRSRCSEIFWSAPSPRPRSLAKTSQTSHLQPPSLRTQGPSAAHTRAEKRSESAPQATGEASRKWSTTSESGSSKGTTAGEGRKGGEEDRCGRGVAMTAGFEVVDVGIGAGRVLPEESGFMERQDGRRN